MSNIIDEILSLPEFDRYPPVLLDIGASEEINKKWQKITKYSICIAFDADQRDMDYIEAKSRDYRKLHIYNCIASSQNQPILDFYLTKSPYCSSLLEPNLEELKPFTFSPLFEIEKIEQVLAKELSQILQEVDLNYVDWFKTDSQGTDLRLFQNLGQAIIDTVLVAEFEPGIMDAYHGEDKLYSVMAYLHSQGFWMSNMKLEGSIRTDLDLLNTAFSRLEQRYFPDLHRKTPGWAEVTYFRKQIPCDKRSLLLAWIFAILDQQYGFALEIAYLGKNEINETIFEDLIQETLAKFRADYRKRWGKLLSRKIVQKIKSFF